MSILEELAWRGLIQDASEGLERAVAGGSLTAYAGFDPTAPSLHVGSLLPLMGLARLQRAGHRPLAVMGGGTGLIGDPSGKTVERSLLDRDRVKANIEGIRPRVERFLDFGRGPAAARILDNADWLADLRLMDFLRDVGKHFTVNVMLAKESVRRRVDSEEGISFTEFSYMLLQAHDYLVLHQDHGCTLQVGGSDQWGNITAGIELVRRVTGRHVHGLTFPLLTTAAGSKFGKTEAGTVWLEPGLTSPYRFHQFWLHTDDQDVVRYLKAFTWLDARGIAALERTVAEAPEKREAQQVLADHVTELVHGKEALDRARRASRVLFSPEITGLSSGELLEVLEDVPSVELPAGRLEADGLPAVEVLVHAGLAASRGEARRLIRNGGLYLNNTRIEDEGRRITRADAIDGSVIHLRKGRRSHALVRLVT